MIEDKCMADNWKDVCECEKCLERNRQEYEENLVGEIWEYENR